MHPDAGTEVTGSLPTPPGQTAEQVKLGEQIFHGEKGGTCAGCHGTNAKGSPLAPDLTNGKWRWGDGSMPSIAATITKGVSHPKNYRSGMPPLGGAQLMPTDVLLSPTISGRSTTLTAGEAGDEDGFAHRRCQTTRKANKCKCVN